MIALRAGPPLALLAGGWLCLSITALVSVWLPPMFATGVGLAGGAAWLLREVPRQRKRPGRCAQAVLSAASFAFLTYPLWVFAIASCFRWAEWTCPSIEPTELTAMSALCAWFLAPLFEECLYRGRLFDAWSKRMSAAAAVVGTSLLFAVPHVEPCRVAASFVVGCLLAVVKHRCRDLGVCVGVHCGFNLGASLWPRVGAYVTG